MVIRSDNASYPFEYTIPSPAGVVARLARVAVDFILGSRQYVLLKLINFLLIRFQQSILKPARAFGYPYYLSVDPVNICNLRCPLCPTGRRKKGRALGMMSFAHFKKIIDEFAPYLILLDLFDWGEPFLNKDIFAMAAYAHRRGIIVRLSSNLNVFDESMAKRLADARCDFLLLSLFGASQETCSRYQKGTDFARVMRHVEMIRRQGRRLPVVVWRFLVNRHNQQELPRARKAVRGAADILELSSLRCDMSEEIFLDDRRQFENIREWLPDDPRWTIYDSGKQGRRRQRKDFCSYLYANPTINWNGSVSPCCMVWEERYDFGNMFKEGFMRVWNNQYFQASRRLVFRGEKSAVSTICAVCLKNRSAP